MSARVKIVSDRAKKVRWRVLHAAAFLHRLADHLRRGEAMGNYYAKTVIPRAVYLQAAHMSFRKTLKKNGNR